MSGHSKWSQIKHKKGETDKKRSVLFSKLLKAIGAAARTEPNPDFNPRLRTAVETAKANNVPGDNIDRAISKAREGHALDDLIIEAYGPEKSAIIIEALTDNSNRTVAEIRNILSENGAKMGEMGSARWAFDVPQQGNPWIPKFTQKISDEGKIKLQTLLEALENHDDVQKIYTNAE